MAPPSTATSSNRRLNVRRQPALGTVCRLDPGHRGRTAVGLVWNLSSSGISMLLNEPLERDMHLPAVLATVDEGGRLPVTLRIVHVRRISTGDYFLGAQFDRSLAAEELLPFLAEAPLPERKTQR